jgi:hypothetical protein
MEAGRFLTTRSPALNTPAWATKFFYVLCPSPGPARPAMIAEKCLPQKIYVLVRLGPFQILSTVVAALDLENAGPRTTVRDVHSVHQVHCEKGKVRAHAIEHSGIASLILPARSYSAPDIQGYAKVNTDNPTQ